MAKPALTANKKDTPKVEEKAPATPAAPLEKKKFEFKLDFVADIPVPMRGGSTEREFPFDDMDVTTKNHLYLPAEFWTEYKGFTLPLDVSKIKDRVRRSFYGWQKLDKANAEAKKGGRFDLTLSFNDRYEGKGSEAKYIGTDVYLLKRPS